MKKKKEDNRTPVSKCCGVYAIVGGKGLTKYYVCPKCNKDCCVIFV